MYKNVIFREYDIRGIYNGEFDKNFAEKLAKAYCQFLFSKKGIKNPTVILGHDARLSSVEIKQSLSRGLQACGAKVLYIGLVTSPISYYGTFEVPGVDGALMITGSHNPPEYNGFKISVGTSTIFGDDIQELRRMIEKGEHPAGQGSEESFDIFPQYIERNKKEFGDLSGVKVVLDCGNGAAGCVIRRLFESVGLKPTILFEEPDGRFPNHHPDPTVEKNLKDLIAQVKKEGAVVGIGFDGDADRIGIVDHTGRMVYGDELMVIISRAILQKQKGAKIIGDVKCSDRLYRDIEKNGGQPIMWKTGHSLIKEKIKAEKAPFGGEMSGHIFFNDRNYGYDDAMYAALRLIEIIKQTGKNIPQLLEGLPPAFNTPELRVDTTEEKKVLIVEKLKEAFATNNPGADYKLNMIDGIRLSFEDGWALARSSNTQPVLVLRYESTTQAGMDRIQKRIEAIVNKYL
jgi:phosphomannomutase/phosphomannomutase/phosphoglucomutase